jgi:hypothetical protein
MQTEELYKGKYARTGLCPDRVVSLIFSTKSLQFESRRETVFEGRAVLGRYSNSVAMDRLESDFSRPRSDTEPAQSCMCELRTDSIRS